MDTYYDDVYVSLFKEWILRHDYANLTVEINPENVNEIILKSKLGLGKVTFNKLNIIELSVINTYTNDYAFYLHFQMNNLKHAMELFQEMVNCMLELDNKPAIRILLCCSGGLTTSFFCEKMQHACELLDLNYKIDATGYMKLFSEGTHYDVILLAPQIAYNYAEAKKVFHDKIVLKIPPRVFAAYNVREMFALIDREVKRKGKQKSEIETHDPINHNILTISLFRDHHRNHLKYILHTTQGKTLVSNEVIKSEFKITDIYDIIDTVMLKYKDIEAIGLAVPGIIVDNSRVWKTSVKGLSPDINFYDLISSRYHVKFYLGNDANAASIGLYSLQNECHSLIALFQPALSAGGAGVVIDGKLIKGAHHISGEMQYLPFFNAEAQERLTTIDGMIDVVDKTIRSLISIIDPEIIVLYCSMIPDLDKLRDKLKENIPEQFIPEIVKIDQLQDYILLGMCYEVAKQLDETK